MEILIELFINFKRLADDKLIFLNCLSVLVAKRISVGAPRWRCRVRVRTRRYFQINFSDRQVFSTE